MNLSKLERVICLVKSSKIEKKNVNVGIEIEYISLLKKEMLKDFFFEDKLDTKKPKNMQIFSYLKFKFWHMSKKFFF